MGSASGHTNVGWPAKNYIHQLCVGTGCSEEYLPRVKADSTSVLSTGLYIYIYRERERDSQKSLL